MRIPANVVIALSTLALACVEDKVPDVPGPPRLERALAVEIEYASDGSATYLHAPIAGDPTLPENWNGMGADVPAVPDLLTSTAPVVPTTSLRLIFNELLDGASVETLVDGLMPSSMLNAGVVTIAATPPAGASAAAAAPVMDGYFQPSGTPRGAPPGPALVLLPAPALPSNSMITVTVSGALVKDTAGTPMGADRTVAFTTAPLALSHLDAALLDEEHPPAPDAVMGGIAVFFNTVLDPASVPVAAFELRRGDAAGAPIMFELHADPVDGHVIAPVLVPTEPVAEGDVVVVLVHAAMLRDTFGIAGTETGTAMFTVGPAAME